MSVDVLKQIARSASQGKPTMSNDERTNLAMAVLANPKTATPGMRTYLKSNVGQDGFLLPDGYIKDDQKPTTTASPSPILDQYGKPMNS
jgi:hypothetical protein